MAQVTTKTITLPTVSPESNHDVSGESYFIDQPPDQFEQCRTLADEWRVPVLLGSSSHQALGHQPACR